MSEENRNSNRALVRIASGLIVVGFLVLLNHWSTRSWGGSPLPAIGWVILGLGIAVLPGAVHDDGPIGIVFLIISSSASVFGALLLTALLAGVLLFTDDERFEIVDGIWVTQRSLFDRIIELGKDGSVLTMAGFWVAAIANGFTLFPFFREQFMAPGTGQEPHQNTDADAKPTKPQRRCPSCGKKIADYAMACKHCKTILPEAKAPGKDKPK